MEKLKIFVGWDPREQISFDVTAWSILTNASRPVEIVPLILSDLRSKGLYWRPTETKDGQLIDVISQAPMSTEFAISRFLIPHLCGFQGKALFVDSDVLFCDDVSALFEMTTGPYAVWCVQHDHKPREQKKMDGVAQVPYARKNWSSLILYDCGYPANKSIDLDTVNTWPGRDLHRFGWLRDEEIGALPKRWNFLVGYDETRERVSNLHFTLGTPETGCPKDTPYRDEWLRQRAFVEAWERRKTPW